MERAELIEFLRESLRLELSTEEVHDYGQVSTVLTATLQLDGVIISKESVTINTQENRY